MKAAFGSWRRHSASLLMILDTSLVPMLCPDGEKASIGTSCSGRDNEPAFARFAITQTAARTSEEAADSMQARLVMRFARPIAFRCALMTRTSVMTNLLPRTKPHYASHCYSLVCLAWL